MIRGCFLADGNTIIGMGHIMRCIAIANVMIENGILIHFITKNVESKDFLITRNFNTVLYNNLDSLKEFLIHEIYDFIVLDSYDVNNNTFKFLKIYTKKLIYIDDMNLFDYDADLIINTSIGAKYINYNFSSNKKYLLGSDYCILRKEFESISKKPLNTDIKNILITTGGSDSHNITSEILEFMISNLKSYDVKYHIIIGPAFTNIDEILSIAENETKVITYNSPNNMAEIMNLCDIAISAGGNTLYELCACGTPAICFIYADNQKNFVDYFEKTGCVLNIGMYNNINYKYFNQILDKYFTNYEFRKNISEKQRSLVDKKGVYRIVSEIKNLILN